jgi:hypothetical protein
VHTGNSQFTPNQPLVQTSPTISGASINQSINHNREREHTFTSTLFAFEASKSTTHSNKGPTSQPKHSFIHSLVGCWLIVDKMGVIFSALDMALCAVVAPVIMPSLVIPLKPAPRPNILNNYRRRSSTSSSGSSSSSSGADHCTRVKFVWFRLDGLDSVEVVPSAHDEEDHSQQRGSDTTAGAMPLSDRRYVVVMLGNAARMDNHLDTFSSMAFSTCATVIAFDGRGVGKSTGWPCGYTHLVDDYVKQVQRLLSRGVAPAQVRRFA